MKGWLANRSSRERHRLPTYALRATVGNLRETGERRLVAQILPRWNPLTSWMRQIADFQRAASSVRVQPGEPLSSFTPLREHVERLNVGGRKTFAIERGVRYDRFDQQLPRNVTRLLQHVIDPRPVNGQEQEVLERLLGEGLAERVLENFLPAKRTER